LKFLGYAAKFQALDHAVERRGTFLHGLGFKRFDALHVAAAEALAVDILLTTDDRFAACAARNAAELSLPILNPMLFPTL
jgi:predicted nucleic acid-binding protein